MADKPIADPAFMTSIGPRRWCYETSHAPRHIKATGYFDTIRRNLRVDDRIDVISFAEEPASHFMLVVDSITNEVGSGVKTSSLVSYKRTAS